MRYINIKEEIVNLPLNDNDNCLFHIEMAGISYCDGTYKIMRTNSSVYVFEFILRGQGTVVCNSKIFHPSAGDIYILHQGSNHVYYSDREDPWVKIWFNAKGRLIKHLIDAYELSSVNHIKGLNLELLFNEIYETIQSKKDSSEEILSRAAVVLHEIIQQIHLWLNQNRSVNNSEAIKIKHYLDLHLEDHISLQDLGRHIFRSQAQVIRLFKKQFGKTPYDYLLEKRIQTAKLLLKNTNLMVKEIAFKLNFTDEHYFSNRFKAKTGISPNEFRKMK